MYANLPVGLLIELELSQLAALKMLNRDKCEVILLITFGHQVQNGDKK